MKFGVGQSVKRTEDIRFVTGQGQYTDDLHFDNETFACFVRSPHGHARINSVDVTAAKEAPGIVDVLTYDDIKAFGAGPIHHRLDRTVENFYHQYQQHRAHQQGAFDARVPLQHAVIEVAGRPVGEERVVGSAVGAHREIAVGGDRR